MSILSILLDFSIILSITYAIPINDEPAGAITVAPGDDVPFNTIGASKDTVDNGGLTPGLHPSCASSMGRGVWYVIHNVKNLHIHTTPECDEDSEIWVYTAENVHDPTTFQCVYNDDDGAGYPCPLIDVNDGIEYATLYILVGGEGEHVEINSEVLHIRLNTEAPTRQPSNNPTYPSAHPSRAPTRQPSAVTSAPSSSPTDDDDSEDDDDDDDSEDDDDDDNSEDGTAALSEENKKLGDNALGSNNDGTTTRVISLNFSNETLMNIWILFGVLIIVNVIFSCSWCICNRKTRGVAKVVEESSAMDNVHI